jgi:hypothetical protein
MYFKKLVAGNVEENAGNKVSNRKCEKCIISRQNVENVLYMKIGEMIQLRKCGKFLR